MKLRYLFIMSVLLLNACATTENLTDTTADPDYAVVPNPYFAAIAVQETRPEKDHAAILAMQGDYRVDFHFQETVPLKHGYELHDDKDTGGFEQVLVVTSEPRKVVLQHILVAPGGHVIKHWRQDWTYEAEERFEFVADQRWEIQKIHPELAKGSWTQCVYEVSDAPRYCGTGKWNHRYGVSTWTSDRSWRPLPRREYTKRSDYNAINAENRHTVTPNGWTHEQDNTKTVRDGVKTKETLVREFGFNDYRNIVGYDFAPAQEYWDETSDYWAQVREAWAKRMTPGEILALNTGVDGMPIIVGTFAQAAKASETSHAQQREDIDELLAEWTAVEQPIRK